MNKQTRQITPKQIEDWSESPVTEALLEKCKEELEDIRTTTVTDCLLRGEPQKTQENIIELEARENVWASWVALLEGDWAYFEEDEEEEWKI